MYFDFLNKEEYKDIPLYDITLDGSENAPVSIEFYSSDRLPTPIHRHKCMQINYIAKGKAKHIINHSEHEVVKGDIFIIPPFVPHRISAFENVSAEICEFEFLPEFINHSFQTMDEIESFYDFAYIEPFIAVENQVKPRLNLSGLIQTQVEEIFTEVLYEFKQKQSGYSILIKSLLLKLLVILGREFTKQISDNDPNSIYTRHKEAVYSAIKYMNENYDRSLSIEEVAQAALFSPSYFSQLFKTVTSKNFVEYLNEIRLKKAIELLVTTDKRVLDISCDTGFNNVSYFTKLFKEKTGVSPLKLRQQAHK